MRRVGLACWVILVSGGLWGCGAAKPAPETALDVKAHDPTPEVVPPVHPLPDDKEGASTPAPTATTDPASAAPKEGGAAVSSRLDELNEQMIQVLNSGGSGGASIGVLQAGTPTGTAGLQLGGGGGAMVPGNGTGTGSGVASISGGGLGGSPPTGPVGKVSLAAPAVMGSVSNASPVVAGMAAGFRRCYNLGLKSDPAAKGDVTLEAQIGTQGEVLSVSAGSTGNLPATVVSCVKARFQSAMFAPPDKGRAKMKVKASFEPAP